MNHKFVTLTLIWGLLMGVGCNAPEPATTTSMTLPYYNEASFSPKWYNKPTSVPADFHSIPAFTLQDQTGQTITEATFENKIYIANFFFTACPGICPMTMSNMKRLQAAFEEDGDILLLSHSVTPGEDDIPALRKFAEKTKALNNKWHLATGSRAEIYSLGKSAYFAEEDLGTTEAATSREEAFLHTESFLLIDKHRRIRGVYNGMNTASVSQLIEDVARLKAEQVG